MKGLENPAFVNDFELKNDNRVNNENNEAAGGTGDEPGVAAPAERAQWGKSVEFLMSCIAMNVGLGNIWRFPFVAYENGGGAFLVPYILVLLFLGRPMYYLEMCLGQFSSRGNVKMFSSLAPALKGVGYGQLVGTVCVATYYCTLMAITLFYLANSFTADLPWARCDPAWQREIWLANATCLPSRASGPADLASTVSSSELWFRIYVLRERYDLSEGIGLPDGRLAICLLISWAITFLICVKGVQSSGKASYFLAVFPFAILFALLARAVTLDGAADGILYFIKPDWAKLLSAKVWYSAVTQCFFSLNVGFGSITMYASYNSFHHNVYRDAMVVTSMDTGTSLLAGFIIFGILGNLARKMEVDVADVVKAGGTGLAFISYPEAIARFDFLPWLFAILFFCMLFVLGVGSLVALQGCVLTAAMDTFPRLRPWHVSLASAAAGFLVGLVYITPGGQFIFTMVDFFGGTFIFYVLNIVEIVAVIHWYGLENVCLDIEFMLGKRPGAYWRLCWAVLIPAVLVGVLAYFVATLEAPTYDGRPYPRAVLACGWALLALGVAQPPLWWGVGVVRASRRLGCWKAGQDSGRRDKWGPQDRGLRTKWTEFKEKRLEESRARRRPWALHKVHVLLGK